ncbi:MAG: hypothetical protein ACXAEU_19445 [Candidatus Hodarchaeales archaeon]
MKGVRGELRDLEREKAHLVNPLSRNNGNDSDNYYVLQPNDPRLSTLKEYIILEKDKPVLYNGATTPQLAQLFRELIVLL